MRTLLTTILLLVLTGPLLAQAPPAGVKTGEVGKELVREKVTGVATVEPWLRTVLSSEIAGLVKSYPLREGDEVTAEKTVVCELKTEALQIDLAEAEALLLRAKAETATTLANAEATMEETEALWDRAKRELERTRGLLSKEVVNQADLDRAEAEEIAARFQAERARKNYELAKSGNDPESMALEAEVRRAEARLARVKDQIAKATIKSPVSGRVVRRMTEVGGWVTPGTPLLEIVTLNPALVRVGVNERELPKIALGDTARVTLDALPGVRFSGTVRFIVPEADPKSRSFPVYIEVENKETVLKAGMFARVEIEAGEAREALTAPKDAVVRGPRGTYVCIIVPMTNPETGEPVFQEMNGRKFPMMTWKAVPVRTGLEVDGRVVVEGEGISDGLEVITTGNEKLIPGQPILPPRKGPPGGGGGHPGGGGPPGGELEKPGEGGR